MAWMEKAFEGVLEGGAATGVAVGVGLLLVPGLLPAVGRILRPVAVGAIKTGMSLYEQTASTVRETTEDLVAEARAELEADAQSTNHRTRRRARPAEV